MLDIMLTYMRVQMYNTIFYVCEGSPDLLVMIDQHAAHERVRLEALIDGMILLVYFHLANNYLQ